MQSGRKSSSEEKIKTHWDVTKRSVLLSREVKEEVNARVSEHIRSVREAIASDFGDANIYLSGSLAVGEPSFSDLTAKIMRSDIDLVLVSEQRIKNLSAVEERLQGHFPEYCDTLYWLDANVLSLLRSQSARNLIEGMASPVRTRQAVPMPPPVSLNPAQILPAVIYQIVGAYFSESPDLSVRSSEALLWHQPPHYHETKLASDLMKFCANMFGGPFASTIRDAFDLRYSDEMKIVFKPTEIEHLVASREIGEAISKVDLPTAMIKALSLATGCEEATEVSAIRACCRLVYAGEGVVRLYGPLVLSTWFAMFSTEKVRLELVAMANALWCRICQDPVLNSYGFELENTQKKTLDELVKGVGQLRLPYIREKLRLKDSGVHLWPSAFFQVLSSKHRGGIHA